MDERAANDIQTEDREARVFQEIARIPLWFEGAPIAVRFLPGLTAHRGKLVSSRDVGQPVFAGSFLRRREIVLDSALRDDAEERARILVHELFHFVWLRMGNQRRAGWAAMLQEELARRARGELGWSSEWRKRAGVTFRDYACESFCDTAAWLYAGVLQHDEFTLATRWRVKRRTWFEANVVGSVRI